MNQKRTFISLEVSEEDVRKVFTKNYNDSVAIQKKRLEEVYFIDESKAISKEQWEKL